MKINKDGFELCDNDWFAIMVIVFLIMLLK